MDYNTTNCCKEVKGDVELNVILLIYWEYKPLINIKILP